MNEDDKKYYKSLNELVTVCEELKEENKQLKVQYNLKCLLMDEAHVLIANLERQREDIINSMQLEIDRLNLELFNLTNLSNEEVKERADIIRKRLGI